MKIKKWSGTAWVQEYPEVDVNNIVATGTPSSSNFLRGDGAWAVPADVDNYLPLSGGTLTGSLITSGSGVDIDLDRESFITFYGGGSAFHSIGSRSASGSAADDLRVNSFGAVYINLDSNNNNTSLADFRIGRHGQTTTINDWLLTLSGENGDLQATSFSSDGTGKFYAWRAVDNTSSGGAGYYRIANISGSQSTRFQIEVTGRSQGYGDGNLPNFGKIIGQLNNDNNYDVWFFNNSTGTSEPIQEVGTVDDGTTGVNIWIKVSSFSEVAATAVITDGNITVYDTNSFTSTEPTGYAAVGAEYKMWNAGNDGSGSGLDADLLDGQQGSYYTGYTDTAIANLVDSSPDALNTLNELAAALGDDENFSTTVTNSIATKLPLAGGTMSGSIAMANNNITGINQIEINDPGEGIVFKQGSSGDMTLKIIDDSTDNILEYSGSNAKFRVAGSLDIKASNPVLTLEDTGTTTGNAYIDYQAGTSLKVHAGADPIVFIAGNSEKARLTAGNGNLGLGTTNPGARLEVIGDIKIKQGAGYSNYGLIDQTEALMEIDTYSVNTSAYPADIVFRPNLTERVRITDDGNVGIGTTSPASKLEVSGDIQLQRSNEIIFGETVGGNPRAVIFSTENEFSSDYNGLGFSIGNQGRTGPSMYIRSDGKVGIGTTTPAEKLTVSGKVRANDNFEQLGSGGYYLYTDAAGFRGAFYDNGSVTSIYGDGNGSTPVININSDKVGIGTSAPSEKLEVYGNIKVDSASFASLTLDRESTTSSSVVNFTNNNGTVGGVGGFGNDGLQFRTSDGTQMVIDASNRVGIGDESPQGKLTVEQNMTNGGSAFSNPHLALNASNTTDNTGFVGMTLATSTADNYGWSYGAQRTSSGIGDLRWRNHSGTSAGNDRMILTSGGNLGVGVSSPSYAVDVSGDVNVTGNFKINGANLEAGGNTWTEIKTGSTTISSGTAVTNVSLGSNTVDDTTVLAIEINSGVVTSYTSEIIIVKLEDSDNSAAGILYNASANSSSIQVGSVRVFRTLSMGPTSTSISFTDVYYFTNGSSSETADTIYVGKIWKLGVTGS